MNGNSYHCKIIEPTAEELRFLVCKEKLRINIYMGKSIKETKEQKEEIMV